MGVIEARGPRLMGASNFRDIGGSLTTDGRRFKRSRVFRSDHLSRLVDDDLDVLRGLGIGFVLDLRTLDEMTRQPTRWPDGLQPDRFCAHIRWNPQINGRPMAEYLKENPTAEGAAMVVDHTFVVLPPQCGPALKQLAERLAHDDAPALFHCTSGKDRTGVIAIMLMHMLGMPRETIVADFLLTNERLPVDHLIANTREYMKNDLGVELDVLRLCIRLHAHHVDIVFDTLAQQYGSVQEYLQAFGIDATLQERMRDRLLEPA